MAAPSDDAAMMLWPQACPTSGSASYSAQKTMWRSPVARGRAKGGRQDRDAAFDRRSPPRSAALGDGLGALELLVAQFGVGVDEVAQRDEFVARRRRWRWRRRRATLTR